MPQRDHLDPRRTYWVPAVIAPARGWAGIPDSHKGSRYLLDPTNYAPSRQAYAHFETRAQCLEWIMIHRTAIAHSAPGTTVRAVSLAHWMLGLD